MTSSINDYIEIAGDFSRSLVSPLFYFMFFGTVLGLLVVIWGILRKQKLFVDWFGLLVCGSLMLVYLVLPLGPRFSSGERLDVERHGYFSFADIYSWLVVVIVISMMAVWSVYRLIKLRKDNHGISLLIFALLTIFAALVGQLVSSKYGGSWTS